MTINMINWANQEDSERGWDGWYLDSFLDWCEDEKGLIVNGEITKIEYDVLRREFDNRT